MFFSSEESVRSSSGGRGKTVQGEERVEEGFSGDGRGAMLLAFAAGVALAAFVQCDGGRCEGTMDPDQIDGFEVRDFIFAKAGDVKLGDVVGSSDRIFG